MEKEQHTSYTKVLLMQDRQQVPGQARSFVFDTVQMILMFSLLFMCARVRFLYFIICMVINAKCMPQGHFLSVFLPGRSEQQVQLREKWCKGRSSSLWLILDTWSYCFDTTSSYTAKKTTPNPPKNNSPKKPKTPNKNTSKLSDPTTNSLKAQQYLADVILFPCHPFCF